MAKSWANEGTTRRQRIRESYARFVEPAASGLPNWRVVTWFPALIAFGAILLIVFNVSGTSSGGHWLSFGEGVDPRALLGGPRLVRSDEWLVQQGWIVSQYHQGFPAINGTLPGGMDATVLNELPTWDWSTLFRPHMWGYLIFGLDVGVAWQWWIPAFALVSGAYLLIVTLAPRRSISAAMVACAVFLSPIFQWWYGPNGIWPTAWSLLAITAVLWALRDPRLWTRIVWAVVVGWLAVTMAIGLYIPFMVPSLLVFVFVVIGAIIQFRPNSRARVGELFRRLAPILGAGVVAGAVVLLFVRTRIATFDAVTSTVYPGARSDPTGLVPVIDPYLSGIGGAAFGQSFRASGVPTLLGPNASESATAIAFAVFVAPAMIALIVRAIRRERRVDWLSIGALVALAIVLAYLFIPGWDTASRLLLLDKVPAGRMRIAFAATLPVFFALIVREVDRVVLRRAWIYGAVSALLSIALVVEILVQLIRLDPGTLSLVPLWPVVALAIAASVFFVFIRGLVPIAAASLLLASLIIGGPVNPLYRGAFDLSTDTEIGQDIEQIEESAPGDWVGVGSYETMAVLMESGASGYSGVQAYPPREMWEQIDPTGRYESAWNRLAHVRWEFGDGDPVVSNPQQDVVLSTFDPCAPFAQEHVEYVLTDNDPPDLSCLQKVTTVTQGQTRMTIYDVVPAR